MHLEPSQRSPRGHPQRSARFSAGHIGLWLLLGLTTAVLAILLLGRQRAGQVPLPVLGQVSDFRLTNQWGQTVTAADLRGFIWVADLIFTRCAGPCPRLSTNLAGLQRRLTSSDPVRLITLTADPDHDSVEVLRAYAERYGAKPARWHFLHGPRPEINDLARRQLLLALDEKPAAEREDENDLFLHSTKWVLVDSQGRLRGVYEGTEPESIDAAWGAIRRLQRGE